MTRHHYVGIDYLRAISAFFIVGCHIALLDRTTGGRLATHFCDTNVGVFAAISGFLFAHSLVSRPAESWKEIVLGRVRRLLPIYLAWSFAYLIVRLLSSTLIRAGDIANSIRRPYFLVRFLFAGGGACHLWFLIDLLYVQILLVLIWRFLPRIFHNSSIIGTASICMLLLSAGLPGNFFYHFARMLSFVLLGVLVHRFASNNIGLSRLRLFFLVLLAIALAVYVHLTTAAVLPRFVRDYLLVLPLLYGAVEFDFRNNVTVAFFSRTSLGVFLWHPFFAVGCAHFVAHFAQPSYSAGIIVADWFCVYLMALCATIATFALGLKRWVV